MANGNNCSFIFAYTFVSLGHNLSDDLSCQFVGSGGLNLPSDINNMPAGLAPLAPNPPGIHALMAGSLAIDAVPLADCTDADGSFITTDQRGVPRPQGAACDIGAFELTTDEPIQNLGRTIANMDLLDRGRASLSAPLTQASTVLNDDNPNNDIAICGNLNIFIDEVDIEYGSGTLSAAQASQLLQAANAIMASLGC